MTQKMILNVPLNRVEGDLELRVQIEDGYVVDAWSSGTMYRGFENIMVGRAPLDGLVITPRICGICSTAHLTAAAQALDAIAGIGVSDDAQRIRNLALMVEHIQSDMRHAFLLFMPDLANPIYRDHFMYEEAVRRYAPLKGTMSIETIRETKRVLEIVAILGGQWPHSSYMAPGGVISMPTAADLTQCSYLLSNYRRWYENRVLGCPIERWLQVDSVEAMNVWLDEVKEHENGELGFFLRFARSIGLDKIGRGHGNFLSYGSLNMPLETAVPAPATNGNQFTPAGFAEGQRLQQFDQERIAEHVAHSWFVDYGGGRHPFEGETRPYATGGEGDQYSWGKAPRYNDLPAETGPLAEMIVAEQPLFTDLISQDGSSVLARELARLIRPAILIPAMEVWLQEVAQFGQQLFRPTDPIEEGEGFGLVEATRGALGHWVKIEGGLISHYQIIPPTSWNASPRDTDGIRGPWEEALIGTEVPDSENPVAVGHVVRSYDACLVCTVHTYQK